MGFDKGARNIASLCFFGSTALRDNVIPLSRLLFIPAPRRKHALMGISFKLLLLITRPAVLPGLLS